MQFISKEVSLRDRSMKTNMDEKKNIFVTCF